MRFVLDTNIVLDMLHFADRHAVPIEQAIRASQVQCFADNACLAELERVAGYPEFGMDPAAQQTLMRRYRELMTICEAVGEEHYPLPRCRDADDQKFLVLAARCHADMLITRDRMLLELARHRQAPPFSIVTAETAVRVLQPSAQATPEDPAPGI